MISPIRALTAQPGEFSPDLLAIQSCPAAKLPRGVMYLVFALFAILVLWATFGRLDIVASADGRLVPQTYIKIVQPAEAGIVRDLLVREGEIVEAGQALMLMDANITQADLKTLRTDLALKALTLRRIDAELGDRRLQQRADDPTDLYIQIEAQFHAHRQTFDDASAQERAVLAKARHDLAAAREVLSKLEQVLPSYRKSAAAYENLGHAGFAGALLVQEKVRERIEKEQDRKAQTATIESLKAAIAQSEKRLAQVVSNYRSQLQNERVDTEGQYQKLTQELDKQNYKASLLMLKAPQAGIVKDIATHTRGTVVSPGTVLLTIVPHDEPLQAEIMVRNEDVGFVFPGQKVKVKLAAYPFQKYGMLEGTVTHLSADATESNQQPSAEAPTTARRSLTQRGALFAYRALVTLETRALEREGTGYKLAPGMQVVAEINQGDRTVMEYLLSPVQRVASEAGRER